MSECGRSPSPPVHCAVTVTAPRGWRRALLCTSSNGVRDKEAVRSPAWRAGRAGGCSLPHRSGQLPQEAPRLSPSPSLGAAWKDAPGPTSLVEPPAPSLSRHRCQRVLGGQMQR